MSTFIFGRHPVADAIRSGKAIDKIYLQQGIRGEMEIEMRRLSKEYGIPMSVVPSEKLNKIAPGNHQGVVGVLSIIQYYRLDDILPMVFERSETPLILLLDSVTDVRNFGAIARSAACCGVHAIVIKEKNAAPVNAEAVKASAGALLNIPVCRESSLQNAIEVLLLSGVQIVASDLRARKPVFEIDFTIPTAILMGSEDEGVSPALLRKVRETFIIPQTNMTDSFNVSVATGIILYEATRQRMG